MDKKHCMVCKRCLSKSVYGEFFCTRRCYDRQSYRVYIGLWLKGAESGGSPGIVSKYVRRWIFENRGRRCEDCGWAQPHPKTGKPPVEINHVNGNPHDHRPENLEVLCPNCHRLTENHGGHNYGNGRKLGGNGSS